MGTSPTRSLTGKKGRSSSRVEGRHKACPYSNAVGATLVVARSPKRNRPTGHRPGLLPAIRAGSSTAPLVSSRGSPRNRGQKVLQGPQLALGPLIDAERKVAVVRVKRE